MPIFRFYNGLCHIVILLLANAIQIASAAVPIDSKLDGPQSIYTEKIVQLLQNWPPRNINYDVQSSNPVNIQCLETPKTEDSDNEFYIGIQQWMRVDASILSVEKVLDDINHYKDLFEGFKEIRVLSKDENNWLTSWEQIIPFFFIPNVKYQMRYIVDKSSPTRKVYRYKLVNSNNLKFNDGLIVIENKGPNSTLYTEYDFWDADWGIAKSLAPGRIWQDSVEGVYLSDVAIKLKSEHPDWSYEAIREKSKKSLDQFPIKEKIKNKNRFELFEPKAPNPH